MIINKHNLIKLLLKDFKEDIKLICLFAKMTDEELAEVSGLKILRRGYFYQ